MLGFANNLLVILEFMTCEVFFFFLPELAPVCIQRVLHL